MYLSPILLTVEYEKLHQNGEVNPGSMHSGFADGSGVDAKFEGLAEMALDAQLNVYVADTENNRIQKIT